MISTLALALLAAQNSYARYLIDVPGEVVETVVRDTNQDGLTDIWLASLDGERRFLSCFQQSPEGGFPTEPLHHISVSRAVVAWAVGNFLGGEEHPGPEIIFTTREAVYLQSPGGRPKKIYQTAMLLDLPAADDLPAWQDVLDIDGDGLDEIVLPTRIGYLLLNGDGKLIVEIPWSVASGRAPVAQRDLFGGMARAKLSSKQLSDLFVPNEAAGVLESPPMLFSSVTVPRPSMYDVNGDGRIDFTLLDGDRLLVYTQAANGSFVATPNLRLDLPNGKGDDNEILEWGNFGGASEADLLLLQSDSGLNVSFDWQIRIWFDVALKENLGQPDFFRKVSGSFVRPYLHDVDQDGLIDLAVSSWNLNLGLAIREPSVTHRVFLFPGAKEGGFTNRAALSYQKDFSVGDLESFALIPALNSDLDGDGYLDLLENSGKGELEVHPLYRDGVFKVRDSSLRIPIDALAAKVQVADLNLDQVGDLLVQKYTHWEVYLSR
jgi:hypothetical protein